jgi:nucleotide-binding universal stress UspA family protein
MFETILLAVDGSVHGQHAAKTAGDLARAVHASDLRIVVAFEPIPTYLGEPILSEAIAHRTMEAQEILQNAQKVIGSVPAEINTEVIEGSIAEAIIDVACVRKSDLIVMGSRGLGRLAGAVLGSNSQKVVSHAPCPVLVVR